MTAPVNVPLVFAIGPVGLDGAGVPRTCATGGNAPELPGGALNPNRRAKARIAMIG